MKKAMIEIEKGRFFKNEVGLQDVIKVILKYTDGENTVEELTEFITTMITKIRKNYMEELTPDSGVKTFKYIFRR